MGLRVATGTVSNKINGLGRNLSGPAAAILAVLLNAHVLHIDETSFKVNGKIVWVWIFLDPVTESALYVLRPSRGRDVLKEVLAGFKGTIVCDGWRPYRAWRIQRCWAHIIREARYLTEAHPRSAAARDIHERLKRVHQLGLDAKKRRMSRADRVRLRAALLGQVTRILNDHRGNPTASQFLTKLEGAADDLFEFVLDPPSRFHEQRGRARPARDRHTPQDPRHAEEPREPDRPRQPLHVRHDVEEPGAGPRGRAAQVRLNGPK